MTQQGPGLRELLGRQQSALLEQERRFLSDALRLLQVACPHLDFGVWESWMEHAIYRPEAVLPCIQPHQWASAGPQHV